MAAHAPEWYVVRASGDGNCLYATLALAETARRALTIAGTAASPAAAKAQLAHATGLSFEQSRMLTSLPAIQARSRAIRAEVAAYFAAPLLGTPLPFDANA